MGHSYSTMCSNCSNSEDHLMGIGMRGPYNMDGIIEYNKSMRDKVFFKYIRDNKNAKLSSKSSYKMYECPSCKTLHSRFYIKINYDNNELYVKEYYCGKCHNILVPLDEDNIKIKNYYCKKCNKKTLGKGMSFIQWD